MTRLDDIADRGQPILGAPEVSVADLDAVLVVAQAATDPWLVGHLADHHATRDDRFAAEVYAVHCGECGWDNPNPERADWPCPSVRLREALAPLLVEDGAT